MLSHCKYSIKSGHRSFKSSRCDPAGWGWMLNFGFAFFSSLFCASTCSPESSGNSGWKQINSEPKLFSSRKRAVRTVRLNTHSRPHSCLRCWGEEEGGTRAADSFKRGGLGEKFDCFLLKEPHLKAFNKQTPWWRRWSTAKHWAAFSQPGNAHRAGIYLNWQDLIAVKSESSETHTLSVKVNYPFS